MEIQVQRRLLRAILLSLFMSWSTFGQTYTIHTVAGTGGLDSPRDVAVDAVGNLFVATMVGIDKVSNGVVTTVAGSGFYLVLGDNGPATSAYLYNPGGVALDSSGNLYIADQDHNRIRKVSNGVITTVAGNGTQGFSGDNSPATNAQLYDPERVAVDSAGNLYIADTDNYRIRKVSNGVITTVAGNGTRGFSGDNILATGAQLHDPFGVAVDGAGNLYIADSGNNRIRKVSNGVITTVAGTGTAGYSGDDGPATSAQLWSPQGVALDAAGNLYIADGGNFRIRKVSNGVITTVAGDGTPGYSGDNGPATSAQLYGASAVAVDSVGNVYIADWGNDRIRILTPVAPCTYSVSPTAQQVSASGGGSGFFNVTAGSGCTWTATIDVSWITITSAISGTGNGTVTYSVPANSGPQRTGHVTVQPGPWVVTVTQAAAGSSGGTGTPQFNLNSSNSNTVTVFPSHYIPGSSTLTSVAVASTLAGTTEITYTATVAYASGDPQWLLGWVAGSPVTGTTPSNLFFLVGGQVGQLSPGLHTAAITLIATSPASGVTNATITITCTDGAGGLNLGTSSMTFSAQQSGTAPVSQMLTVSASSTTYYTASASSNGNWLSMSPMGSLNTSSNPSLMVSVNQAGLTANTYYGTITLVANGIAQTVQVILVVSGSLSGGGLTLGTSSMTFSAQQSGTAPVSQMLTVSASSTTYYTASASSNGNWLSISPMGSLNTGSSPSLMVSVNQAGLTPNTYYGTITLVANGIALTVQVTLVVSGSLSGGGSGSVTVTANNQAGTPSLSFSYTVGGSAPVVQTLQVVSASGSAPVSFTITSSATWLSVGVQNGTSLNTPVSNPGFTVAIVTPLTLTPSPIPYTAAITIAPNGGSQVLVPVTLTVQAAPTVTVTSATALSFSYQAGGANPTPATVNVSGGGQSLGFTAQVTSGSNWLSVSPTSGTTPTTGTAALTVTANPGTLGAGSYTGTILVSGTGTATGSTIINVTLTVTAPLPTIKGVTNAASYATGAVSPGELVTIFGTAIGPATAAGATTDPSTGKLATTIGGVQVLFNGIAAPMIYASSTQVSAVVPYEMAPVVSPSVWIKYVGQTSNAFQVTTAATAPGLFTQNASGSGPGAILNQDNSVNGPGNRAAKGSILQVFMTGEGQTSPPSFTAAITTATLPPPQVTPAPLLAVGVTINGLPALYVYAGEAPGLVAGMMQLNVQIPANAPSGDLQILVSIGGNTSQSNVTVSVQ